MRRLSRAVRAAAGLVALLLAACQTRPGAPVARALVAEHCAACHEVPGVSAAVGRVGPPLAGLAHRQVIAGRYANTPSTLVRWIVHPQSMLPGCAMPEMGLTEAQGRTIAGYLASLE